MTSTLVRSQFDGPAEPSGPCKIDTFSNSLNDCSKFSICPHGQWINTQCPSYFLWDLDKEMCVYSRDGMGVACVQA